MNEPMKNIRKAAVLMLKDEVSYQKGPVASKTLAQNDALSVTLFSFDKGEEISTHAAPGDAFVAAPDGVGRITIDGKKYELSEGQKMPDGNPAFLMRSWSFFPCFFQFSDSPWWQNDGVMPSRPMSAEL